VKGDVVIVSLPFTDFSSWKRRPALVVAKGSGEDLIICRITSRSVRDQYAIKIDQDDFESGFLRTSSNVRPNKLMTIHRRLVMYKAGRLACEKVDRIVERCVEVLRK